MEAPVTIKHGPVVAFEIRVWREASALPEMPSGQGTQEELERKATDNVISNVKLDELHDF